MKIAALYDIHGNLPALNAVLNELEEVAPDIIVAGGDILDGPLPKQTLERLFELGGKVLFIRGNGEREVVTAFEGLPLSDEMSPGLREITEWIANQLTPHQGEFLAALPLTVTVQTEKFGDILFCHATPQSDEEMFTSITPEERLTEIFSDVEQPLVVCGHTHIQHEWQVGSVQILNAGSVGMPFSDPPGAYWLLLSDEGYEFRTTPYDLEHAAEEVRKSGYPQAEEFAVENVLTTPDEAKATELLEDMALKQLAQKSQRR